MILFKFIRFYGYKLDEALEMDCQDYSDMSEGMAIIEAREKLWRFDISSYPHLKKDAQRNAHKEAHKMAYPSRFKTAKALSLDEAFSSLGNL